MKILTMAAAISLAISTHSHADTAVSVIFDAKSQHYIKDEDNSLYNGDHHMKGIVIDNKYVFATLENSFYNRSYMVGYNWEFANWDINHRLNVSANAMLGLVTGYNKEEAGATYINKHVSLYALPSIETSYRVTKDISLSVNFGMLPAVNGVVMVQSFKVNFTF